MAAGPAVVTINTQTAVTSTTEQWSDNGAANGNIQPFVVISDGAKTQFFTSGNPGFVTVSGTVVANAGTNLNTSLLAIETGGNLTAINSHTANIPALGQALSSNSVPVVLPAAQVVTLTPPTTVTVTQGTGTNLHTVVDSGTITANAGTGTFGVSGTVTVNAGTNLNTSLLALEGGGNLATIATNTSKIPSQGQALAAASMPVVLTAAQITTLTPLSTVAATQSGTWTVQPANTPNTVPWLTNHLDPTATTGTITAVDAASTSTTNSLNQTIITGTPTASSSVTCTLSAHTGVTLQISGTVTGTFAFERSVDGGTTYIAFGMEEFSIGSSTTSVTISDNKPYVFRGNAGELTTVRVRCTAYTSGTLSVKWQPGYGVGVSVANQGVPNSTSNGWPVGLTPITSGGTSTYHNTSLGTAPTVTVKNTPGQLYSAQFTNASTTAAAFVKFVDASSNPTIGSATIKKLITLAAAQSATQPTVVLFSEPNGIAFGTGIAFVVTGAQPDADATVVTNNVISVDLDYK